MADKRRKYSVQMDPHEVALPIRAAVLVEAGDCCSRDSSGNIRAMTVADATFAGFSQGRYDNADGDAADFQVRLWRRGEIELTVVGVTASSDEGATVYATAADTFTLSSTGGVAIGKITKRISGTKCRVQYEANSARSI